MKASIVEKGQSKFTLLKAEGTRTWNAFEKITAEIPGFDEFKKSGYYYPLDGAAEGANIYTYLPFLFAEAFPEVTTHQLRRLSLMSLLCLYHILIDDVLMDEKNPPTRQGILTSKALLLRSLQIIDELAGESRPWKSILRLHRDYSVAMLMEHRDHTGALNKYKKSDMMRILAGKSAMAKLVLVMLGQMTGRDNRPASLSRSLDLYYLSDQLFDDFRDWKKDLAAGRYSYLLTTVISSCDLHQKLASLDGHQASEIVGKYLYLSGIAEKYLTEIIDYWQQAIDCAQEFNCRVWISFLESLQMGARKVRANIGESSRGLLLQPKRYGYLLAPKIAADWQPLGVAHPVQAVSSTVRIAATRAAEFLRRHDKDGAGFEDFIVFGQKLSVWVSAYIGAGLTEWKKAKNGRSQKRQDRLLSALTTWLAGKLRKDGWGTNDSAPSCGDSTAWTLMFLSQQPEVDPRIIEAAVKCLLRFQRPDGGFRTYQTKSTVGGFSGYCTSHVEVTAAAALALRMAAPESAQQAIEKAIAFIEERREGDGLWQAYWYDGRMFATYYALRAIYDNGPVQAAKERARLMTEIVAQQGPDGSFGEMTIGRNKSFETALAVRSLLLIEPALADSEPVTRGITWLMNYQQVDGSFASGPMMRVPLGDDERPWQTREWRMDLLDGTGILVRDHNKLFTSATVLSALASFIESAGDYELITLPKDLSTGRFSNDSPNKIQSPVGPGEVASPLS